MRHRIAGRQLGRTSAHRLAMRRNLVASLFEHEYNDVPMLCSQKKCSLSPLVTAREEAQSFIKNICHI